MTSRTFTIAAAPAATIPLVTVPVKECAWCWPLVHPGEPYPEEQSSTICAAHDQWFDRLRAERRARLATSATIVQSIRLGQLIGRTGATNEQ